MTQHLPEFAVDTLCLLDKVSNNVRLELHQLDLVHSPVPAVYTPMNMVWLTPAVSGISQR